MKESREEKECINFVVISIRIVVNTILKFVES